MQWNHFKQLLKKIWLTAAKRSLQDISVPGMCFESYSRHWEEYPWYITETLSFQCLSPLTDLYLVQRVVSRQYRAPDGTVKTEVKESGEWTAAYNAATHVLVELSSADRVIGFLPEKMEVLLDNNAYHYKKINV